MVELDKMTDKARLIGVCIALLFVDCLGADLMKYGTVPPVDQSNSDSTFRVFKKVLENAFQKKDSVFIFAHLDPEIMTCFGADCSGIESFRQEWIACRSCDFWKESKRILQMGCRRLMVESELQFACPYVFQGLPDSLDGYSWVVVTNKNAPVYSDTTPGAKIIGYSSYSILPTTEGSRKWLRIDSVAGKTWGYLERKYVRSPIDPRMIFAKREGEWKMIAYVAGD